MVHEDGSPRVGPAGPEIRIMLVPAEEVSIVETWDSVGLVATGSHDIVFEDVFVPEPRAIPLGPMPSNRHYQGPLYRLPYMALFAWPIAAVALGIAQHAIDIATELAATKVSAGATARSAERPVFQLQLADAVAGVRSGRAWLYEALAELEAIAADGGHAGLPERANAQLAVSNAVRNARAATDLMFLAAGTSALARTGELQRCLRDIHAVSQHVASGPGTWEGMGAILAGGPAQNPLLLL
jgi:alkylation response protein AidB-like acyl-CoA dehydrogenase